MNTKEKALRAAQFLRVIDADNNLSLTNIALMATLARLLMTPQLSIHDLGMFLATVVGYQVKRFALPANAPENTAQLESAVAALQTQVTGLQLSGQRR